MVFRLRLQRTVSIENGRLASVYFLLQLCLVSCVIWSWFYNRGGTVELAVMSQLTFETITDDSIVKAYHFQPSGDPRCLGMEEKQSDYVSHVCTTLSIEQCPMNRSLDACTNFYESLSVSSPFDVQLRIVDKTKTPGHTRIGSNVFTQAYVTELRYRFVVTSKMPTALGLNGDLRTSGTNQHAKTVLLDAQGRPARTYAPGEAILVPLPLILQMMHIPRETYLGNSAASEGSFPGDDTKFPSWVWEDGATIYVSVTCFTDNNDIKSSSEHSDENLWNLGASPSNPVCLLKTELATSWSVALVVMDKQQGIRRSSKNIHFVSKMGVGFFRAFDIYAGILFLTSALVLVRLPKLFLQFFALNCLGQLSCIYKSVVDPIFSVQYFCAKAVMQLVSQSANFVELADQTSHDGVHYGGISWSRMLERVSAVVRHRRAVLDDSEVQVLAAFTFGQATQVHQQSQKTLADFLDTGSFIPGGISAKGKTGGGVECKTDVNEKTLDIDNFCHATGSEEISIDTIAKLFDRDRMPGFLERVFLPRDLWRCVHKSEVVRKVEKESETQPEEGSGERQHDLQVDVDALPLERRKSEIGLAAKTNPSVSGQVRGLGQEVLLVTKELSAMRKRLDELQAALLRESEKRLAAESALHTVQMAVAGMGTAEAKLQREASAEPDLCNEAKRDIRESRARPGLTSIVGRSSQSLPIARSATAAKCPVLASKDHAMQSRRSSGIASEAQLGADASLQPVMRAGASAGALSEGRQIGANDSSANAALPAGRLDIAVVKLASGQSDLFQLVSDQASKMESLERRIDLLAQHISANPWLPATTETQHAVEDTPPPVAGCQCADDDSSQHVAFLPSSCLRVTSHRQLLV